MKHKYSPHWTQPLQNLRILFLLPLAELLHRRAGIGLLCMLVLLQYLPELRVSPEAVCFQRLLLRTRLIAPSRVDVHRPLYLRVLGGVPVRLYTAVHAVPRRSIVLSRAAAQDLHRQLCPALVLTAHRLSVRDRLLTAAFQPHLSAAWALLMPLLRQYDFSPSAAWLDTLPDGLKQLPAPWALLSVTAGVGWLVAFLRRLEESAHLRLYRSTDALAVQCGLLTRRTRFFFLHRCYGVELRRISLLPFYNLASVSCYTGSRRPALLLPAASEPLVRSILPAPHAFSVRFVPPKTARYRFGRMELIGLTVVLPLCAALGDADVFLLQYLFVLMAAGLCLRILVQQFAFTRTTVQLSADSLLVCRCSGWALVTTILPRSGVAAVAVRAHWFQRRAGLCTVLFHAPGLPVLKIRHLRLRDGLQLQRMLTGIK